MPLGMAHQCHLELGCSCTLACAFASVQPRKRNPAKPARKKLSSPQRHRGAEGLTIVDLRLTIELQGRGCNRQSKIINRQLPSLWLCVSVVNCRARKRPKNVARGASPGTLGS